MIRNALIILLAVSLLTGCASTNLQPITSSNYQQLPEEKRIWLASVQEQHRLAKSEVLFDSPELRSYLNQVAMQVLPEAAKKKINFEISIINNPYSNAFAYPNGKIYIHTGILARMQNEAQLATLLGHEMSHVTHRHMVRERRNLRNKAAGLASFNATFGSLPLVGELSAVLGTLGTMASVSGYSKELESEADNTGFKWMLDAGYDPRESPKLFEHLMAEMEEEGQDEPFFFGSHPKLIDRHANYQSFLNSGAGRHRGKVNRETYERAVAPAVFETARLDLKAGRFSKAEKGTLRYLGTFPRSSHAHFLMGEIYRQRNEEHDHEKAIEYLTKASRLNGKHAESYRSLGLIYMSQNDKRAAQRAFQNYLKKAPNALDSEFIQEYIRQLK